MRAAQITELSGPDAVAVGEVDAPALAPGQLLIDVHAAGVNFPDLLMTRGEYQVKPDLPFIPGSEVSGVVSDAPAGSGFKIGDRVASFSLLNGIAEQVVVTPDLAVRIPDSMSFA